MARIPRLRTNRSRGREPSTRGAQYSIEPLQPRVLLSADLAGLLEAFAGQSMAPDEPAALERGLQDPADAATVLASHAASETSVSVTTLVGEDRDLVAGLDRVNVPTAIVEGSGARGSLQVIITNIGSEALPFGQRVGVEVVLRGAALPGGELGINRSPVSAFVSNLGPGQSRSANVSLEIPDSLPLGQYQIVAIVDSDGSLAETDETNNTATLRNRLSVAAPFLDLVAGIGSVNLPATTVSGDGTQIRLPLEVTNRGNVATARNQTVDIEVYAQPQGGGPETRVATLMDQSIGGFGGLGPGQTKRINATVQLPAGLATGTYDLVARVDTSNDVAESNEANNSAAVGPLAVELGEVDLTAGLGNVTLPSAVVAGQGAQGRVPVVVGNAGNVAVPRNQRIDVVIALRPTAGGPDVVLTTLRDQSLGFGLQPGRDTTLNATVTVPATTPAGSYRLVAQVDTSDAVPNERDEGNNEVLGPEVVVAEPFLDLVASMGVDEDLPGLLLAGDGSDVRLPLRVRNAGNVTVERGQTIDVDVFVRPLGGPADGSQDVFAETLRMQSIGNLGVGATRMLNVDVNLPAGLEGRYQIVARIDASGQLGESDETNNEAVTRGDIRLTRDFLSVTASDAVGAMFSYDATSRQTGSPTVTGTSVVTIESEGVDRFRGRAVVTPDNGTFDQELTDALFERRVGGTFLLERNAGAGGIDGSFTYTNLQVAPPTLVLDQEFVSVPAPVGVRIPVPGVGTLVMNGQTTAKITLTGYRTVQSPSGPVTAAEIQYSLSTNASGRLQGVDITLSLTESWTVLTHPDLGEIQSTLRTNARIAAVPGPSQFISGTETRTLTASDIP